MSNLKSLKDKLKKFAKKGLQNIVDLVGLLVFAGTVIYISARSPELHGQYLRSKVGSKVYTIRDSDRSGGGTGFAIKAPSGITYIMTNDHVCGVSSDGQTVQVSNENGLKMRRSIIARSEFSDLCLIEGVPRVEGLSIGAEPMIGQIVASVGHPSLMPITLSRGEVISAEDIPIAIGAISVVNPETQKEEIIPKERGGIPYDQCLLPKHRQVYQDYPLLFFTVKVRFCVAVTLGAYRTNMQIQPGSSGSPVVNFWGQVVGVVFAGDRLMWGSAVSHKDLVEFLKPY